MSRIQCQFLRLESSLRRRYFYSQTFAMNSIASNHNPQNSLKINTLRTLQDCTTLFSLISKQTQITRNPSQSSRASITIRKDAKNKHLQHCAKLQPSSFIFPPNKNWAHPSWNHNCPKCTHDLYVAVHTTFRINTIITVQNYNIVAGFFSPRQINKVILVNGPGNRWERIAAASTKQPSISST